MRRFAHANENVQRMAVDFAGRSNMMVKVGKRSHVDGDGDGGGMRYLMGGAVGDVDK